MPIKEFLDQYQHDDGKKNITNNPERLLIDVEMHQEFVAVSRQLFTDTVKPTIIKIAKQFTDHRWTFCTGQKIEQILFENTISESFTVSFLDKQLQIDIVASNNICAYALHATSAPNQTLTTIYERLTEISLENEIEKMLRTTF